MTLAQQILDYTVVGAFVIVGLCQIMAMIRLVIGPGTGDRILALDTMVVNAIGLIVLMGLAQGACGRNWIAQVQRQHDPPACPYQSGHRRRWRVAARLDHLQRCDS